MGEAEKALRVRHLGSDLDSHQGLWRWVSAVAAAQRVSALAAARLDVLRQLLMGLLRICRNYYSYSTWGCK